MMRTDAGRTMCHSMATVSQTGAKSKSKAECADAKSKQAWTQSLRQLMGIADGGSRDGVDAGGGSQKQGQVIVWVSLTIDAIT